MPEKVPIDVKQPNFNMSEQRLSKGEKSIMEQLGLRMPKEIPPLPKFARRFKSGLERRIATTKETEANIYPIGSPSNPAELPGDFLFPSTNSNDPPQELGGSLSTCSSLSLYRKLPDPFELDTASADFRLDAGGPVHSNRQTASVCEAPPNKVWRPTTFSQPLSLRTISLSPANYSISSSYNHQHPQRHDSSTEQSGASRSVIGSSTWSTRYSMASSNPTKYSASPMASHDHSRGLKDPLESRVDSFEATEPYGIPSNPAELPNSPVGYHMSTNTNQRSDQEVSIDEDDWDDDLAIIDPALYCSKLKVFRSTVVVKSSWYVSQTGPTFISDRVDQALYTRSIPMTIEWDQLPHRLRRLGRSLEESSTLERIGDTVRRINSMVHCLQLGGYAEGGFSILVEDSDNKAAEVIRIPFRLLAEIEDGIDEAVLLILSLSPRTDGRSDTSLYSSVVRPCFAVLELLHFKPNFNTRKAATNLTICQTVVTLIDLGLVSYVGSHCLRFDKDFLQKEMPEILFREIDPDTFGFSCSLRRLTCLEEFLDRKPVWVFKLFSRSPPDDYQMEGKKGRRREHQPGRLSILTHIKDFMDLWGPVWAIPISEGAPDRFQRYEFIKGVICPVRGSEKRKVGDYVACHWYKNGAVIPSPDESRFLEIDDHLLIGAPLYDNEHCEYHLSDYQADFGRKIKILGTKKKSWKADSRIISISVAKILGLSIGMSQKLVPEISLKELIKKQWTNSPERRNPRVLNHFLGLEISHCTGNARRVRLKDLLVAKPIRAILLCQYPELVEQEWGEAFLKALESDEAEEIVTVWKRHRQYRKDMANLVMNVLELLEDTGREGEKLAAAVFFSSEEGRIELSLRHNSWAAWLQDSNQTAVYAFVNEKCIDCDFSSHGVSSCTCKWKDMERNRDQISKSSTALQTKVGVPHDWISQLLKMGTSRCLLQKIEAEMEEDYVLMKSLRTMNFMCRPCVDGAEVRNDDNTWHKKIPVCIKASKESYGGMDSPRQGIYSKGQPSANRTSEPLALEMIEKPCRMPLRDSKALCKDDSHQCDDQNDPERMSARRAEKLPLREGPGITHSCEYCQRLHYGRFGCSKIYAWFSKDESPKMNIEVTELAS